MGEKDRNFEIVDTGDGWTFYGERHGEKVLALQRFQQGVLKTKKLESKVPIQTGASLGCSFFDEFIHDNGLPSEPTLETLQAAQMPASLREANIHLLRTLKAGIPVAVRSSALGEKPNGIYGSSFFVPTGDQEQDLATLEARQREVYASFYTPKALEYRRMFPQDQEGMSILIQPVVGQQFGDYWMPVVSGTVTPGDKPLLRTVIGLGTKAVGLDEAIVTKDFNAHQIREQLSQIQFAQAINLHTGAIETISVTDEMRDEARADWDKLHSMVGLTAYLQQEGKGHYFEFATSDASAAPVILQTAEMQDKTEFVEMGEAIGPILFEGRHTLNTGVKDGRGIIFITDSRDLQIQGGINHRLSNYLLVVPDSFLTTVNGDPLLNLPDFSNASGVIEVRQEIPDKVRKMLLAAGKPVPDHKADYSGSHFAQIAHKADILFLGVPANQSYIDGLLGEPTETIGRSIRVFDVPFRMTNSTKEGSRVEIAGEMKPKNKYTSTDFTTWADEIWRMISDSQAFDFDVDADSLDALHEIFKSGDLNPLAMFDIQRDVPLLYIKKLQVILVGISTFKQLQSTFSRSYDEYEQYQEDYQAYLEMCEDEGIVPDTSETPVNKLQIFLTELRTAIETRLLQIDDDVE